MTLQKKNKRILPYMVMLMMVFLLSGIFGWLQDASAKENDLKIPAKVTASKLNVRKKPFTDAKQLKISKENVVLTAGTGVTILQQVMNDAGQEWYYVSFTYRKQEAEGYVLAEYIAMTLNQSQKATTRFDASNGKLPLLKAKNGTQAVVDEQGKPITLKNNKSITIVKESVKNHVKWYRVRVKVAGKKYVGYLQSKDVALLAYAGIQTGTVIDAPLNVRVGAGTTNDVLIYKDAKVQLPLNTKVTILSSKKVDGAKWYRVTFSFADTRLSGYVIASCIEVDKKETPAPTKQPTEKPTEQPSEEPTEEPAEEPTEKPTEVPSSAPQTEKEFQKSLQDFPESYRAAIQKLHEQYPYWRFEVYNTGLDWETVIVNEGRVGLNLIPNGKSNAWKSFEAGAYNWTTDTFIPYDGSTWVTCSNKALRYYMDPRNFLTTDGIFQFEDLSYKQGVQNLSGVQAILAGTVLGEGKYTYVNEKGNTVSKTYAKTFLDAAEQSGVSPYHLASRVKQEVITSNGLSNSASGIVSGYEGIFNFYNIGANDSTIPGQNIINGLTFASTGNKLSQEDKDKYLIPWTSPYRAIVGGGIYIGTTYITRGQNTVYLQKFNVTSYSRYSHQYMSNVEAPKAEAQKLYTAYKGMETEQVTFSIPVYENMPAEVSAIPSEVKNPNNWLKTLSVYNLGTQKEIVMTPVFNATDAVGTVYSVNVANNVTSINVKATAASTSASVTGNKNYDLKEGTNLITVSVTSESGDTRDYVLKIVRAEAEKK